MPDWSFLNVGQQSSEEDTSVSSFRPGSDNGESLLKAFSATKLMHKPTGTPGFGQTLLGNLVKLFDPLLLPGDVAKSFIYGAVTTGSVQGGLDTAKQQLSQWKSYFPLGEPAQTLVNGDTLSRAVLGDTYNNMGSTKKLVLSTAVEVLTDPLSILGVLGLGAKTAEITTRGVSAAAKAAGVTSVAKGAEAVAGGLSKAATALGTADVAVQKVLNPYAVAGQAVSAVGKLNLGPLSQYREIAEVASDTLSSVLDMTLLTRTVRLPDGLTTRVRIRLGDVVLPNFTPAETKALGEEATKKLLGSPDYGPGMWLRAKAYYQDIANVGLKHVEDIHAMIHDEFGVSAGLRKVIPKEQVGLVNELMSQVQLLVDKFGVDAGENAVAKAIDGFKIAAKSYGIPEDKAAESFRRIYDRTRMAFLDMTYHTTGMPLYEKIYKSVAENMGVDAEEAWQRYLGMKAGYAPVMDEAGRLVRLAQAPKPEFKNLPPGQVVGEADNYVSIKLLENPNGPASLRYFATLSPNAQFEVLQKEPSLGPRLTQFHEAVNAVQSALPSDPKQFQGFVTARTNSLLSAFEGRATDPEAVKALRRAERGYRDENLIAFTESLDKAMGGIGADAIVPYLKTRNKQRNAFGYTALGALAESVGDYENAVVMYTAAANIIANDKPKMARYLFMSGALGPGGAKVKMSLGTNAGDLKDILESPDLSADGVTKVLSWLRSIPGGITSDVSAWLSQQTGPHALLARTILSADNVGLAEIVRDVMTGKVKADAEAAGAIVDIGRNLLGKDFWGAVGIDKAEIPKIRAKFTDTLTSIEEEAVKRYWSERPYWAGIASADDLFGQVGDKGWRGSPFSPLQWFENIKEGYARKLYIGNISPESAIGALMKSRLALIPEMDSETLISRGQAALKGLGRTDPATFAALKDMAEYIGSTDGRYVYSVEALMKIFQSRGIQLSQEEFSQFMQNTFASEDMAIAASRVIAQKQMGAATARPSPQFRGIPSVFGTRIENAEALLQLMDPTASLAELTRYSSRHLMSAYVQNELYKVLDQANLVLDSLPADALSSGSLKKWAYVPDSVVKDAAGREYRPYGPLSGKYIPRAIFEDMLKRMSVDPLSGTAYSSFLSFWRKALLNNPKTVAVNAIGNVWLTYLTQGPQFAAESVRAIPTAIRALDSYYKSGRMPDIAQGAIHFLKEVGIASEARGAVSEAIRRLTEIDPEVIQKGGLQRLIDKADAVANNFGARIAEALGRENDPYIRLIAPIEAFAYVENIQRVANYIAAKRLGKNDAEALWVAANATHDYSNVPYAVRLARDYGLVAFPSFMYLTGTAVGKAMTKNPSAVTIPLRMADMSFYTVPDTPEEHARINTYMAQWLKDSVPMVLPIKREDGSYNVIPLNYIFPMIPSDPMAIGEELFSFGVMRPFIEAATGLMRWSSGDQNAHLPIWSAKYGQTLFKPEANTREAILGALSYVANQFTPSYATRFLPITDIPELIAMKMGDASAINGVKSLVGKAVVQYQHPLVVSELERRLGKQLGYTLPEAAIGLVAAPRRVSPSPLGVGSQEWRQIERERQDLDKAMRNRLKRGEPIDNVLAEYRKRVDELAKKLEPYMQLNEAFGPPPEVGNGPSQ